MAARRHLLFTGTTLLTAISLAACGGGSESTETSDSTTIQAPSTAPEEPTQTPVETPTQAPTTDATERPAKVARNPKPDGTKWKIRLSADGANTDPNSWPDAGKVFSKAEITSVIPSTSKVKVTQCGKGKFIFGPDGGKQTPRNISCYYEITSDEQQDDDRPLRLYVSFRGFLSKDQARERFDDNKAGLKKTATKYPDQWKDLGRNSYWDGTSSHVYVSNDTVGATIQIGGSGSLTGEDDYKITRQRMRDELEASFAKIVQTKL